MKKKILYVSLVGALATSNAMAERVTASTTAKWDAKATKDTTSALVVTPLHSLVFKYGEVSEAFNTQDGAFDITVKGQEGATDFSLEAKIINNTLVTPTGGDKPSTVDVGVAWYGKKLSKNTPTPLLNTAAGAAQQTYGLENLVSNNVFAHNTRASDRASFTFSIDSGTKDGKVVSFKELPDGYWLGSVDVQFIAFWEIPKPSTGA